MTYYVSGLRSASEEEGRLMGPLRFSMVRVERRKTRREPKYCIVRLKFDDGSPALRGMLINLSAAGAQVSISAAREIPKEFTLLFAASPLRRCRLVWRQEQDIGVEFLPDCAVGITPTSKTGFGARKNVG